MGVLATWVHSLNLNSLKLKPAGLQSVRDFWRREKLPQGGIDLGNGRVLGAEDVLEGHYRRMASHRQPVAGRPFLGKPATRQVTVQVGDNLTAAIAVLAPDLAPLTEVAEQVSGAVPLVEPEARFRQNLHQALERTHRQHAAERILGTRPTPRPKPSNPLGLWMALAGLVATLALLWGWRWRQGTAPAA
jgi:hypothetical protein